MEEELTRIGMTQPREFRQTDADGPHESQVNFGQHFRWRKSLTSVHGHPWVVTSLTNGGRLCAAPFDNEFSRVDGQNDIFTRLYVAYKIKGS